MADSLLFQIKVSYATFGVVVEAGRVVGVAPIGSWMRGRSIEDVQDWVAKRGGTLQLVSGRISH